jgi:uncharacterized protein involved in exopolysaccharide biosynthesis
MSETPLNQDQNSDEIDFRDIILPLWKSRKQILTTAIIFAIIGGIIGFLTPATYTASSTFLPQTSQEGGAGASLGGLAALAGINLSVPIASGDISPTMYETVLGSEPFRKRILDSKIWFNEDSVIYRNYLEHQSRSAVDFVNEYTIGLMKQIIDLIFIEKDKNLSKQNKINGLQPLSDKEYSLLNAISSKISIENDLTDGVVKIKVTELDPMVSAQIANNTELLLQDWIREHKVKNAKEQFDFITRQFEAKKNEFILIQDQLAGYRDQNQNVISSSYLTRLERLQAEFDLVNTVYSELAIQKEQAAIQLNKKTPIFLVLDPVKVPKEKSGPKVSIYFSASFFLGAFLSAIWFFFRDPVLEFFLLLKE